VSVVLSDRDAEKIRMELAAHRVNVVNATPDNAYRAQWVGMIDRLMDRLSQNETPMFRLVAERRAET